MTVDRHDPKDLSDFKLAQTWEAADIDPVFFSLDERTAVDDELRRRGLAVPPRLAKEPTP